VQNENKEEKIIDSLILICWLVTSEIIEENEMNTMNFKETNMMKEQ
jgi:hypothetical protein